MIPGLWSLGQFDSTKKFLSAQRKNDIPVWVQAFTTIVHLFVCQKLIGEYEMKEVGAAIASDITFTLNMVLSDALIAYYSDSDFRLMVFPYDSSCCQDLGAYLNYGMSSMLLMCSENWAIECLIILAGLMSVEEQAAQVIIV